MPVFVLSVCTIDRYCMHVLWFVRMGQKERNYEKFYSKKSFTEVVEQSLIYTISKQSAICYNILPCHIL